MQMRIDGRKGHPDADFYPKTSVMTTLIAPRYLFPVYVLISYISREECNLLVHAFTFRAQKIRHVLLSYISLLKCSCHIHVTGVSSLMETIVHTLWKLRHGGVAWKAQSISPIQHKVVFLKPWGFEICGIQRCKNIAQWHMDQALGLNF